jgi:hypothetical protein
MTTSWPTTEPIDEYGKRGKLRREAGWLPERENL